MPPGFVQAGHTRPGSGAQHGPKSQTPEGQQAFSRSTVFSGLGADKASHQRDENVLGLDSGDS